MLVLSLLGSLASRDAQAFYNPSTGRWLSRDPIGEAGGLNSYMFVGNAGCNGIDRFGLNYVWTPPSNINAPPSVVSSPELAYTSEGRAFRDPTWDHWNGITAYWADESGPQKTSDAYYSQAVEGFKGGICNSEAVTSTSFVKASVINRGSCCVRYRFTCQAVYASSQFGGDPKRKYSVLGEILKQPIKAEIKNDETRHNFPVNNPEGITSTHEFSKVVTADLNLEPGKRETLYSLSAPIAFQVLSGASFSESLSASCKASYIGPCTK